MCNRYSSKLLFAKENNCATAIRDNNKNVVFSPTAVARAGSPCRAYEYQCLQGDQCIPASYQCDGEIDCQDRSDEIGCGTFMCCVFYVVNHNE